MTTLFSFLFATLFFFLQLILFFPVPIQPYLPFLLIFQEKKKHALWIAALLGCTLDLFLNDPLGTYAISYVATLALFSRMQKLFSLSRPLSFALYALFASLFSSFCQFVVLFLLSEGAQFSADWPLRWVLDALFAGFFFLVTKSPWSKFFTRVVSKGT